MKTGYDDFFKKARREAGLGRPVNPRSEQARFSIPKNVSAKPKVGVTAKGPATSQEPSALTPDKMQKLRQKIRSARQMKKKRGRFPVALVMASLLGLVATGVGLHYHEQIDRFLGRIELEAMGMARAEAPSAKAPEAAKAPSERSPAAVDTKAPRQLTEDEIDHLQKLVQRKEQLDAREAELQRLEAEIQAQNAELDKKLRALEDTRQSISQVLQERTTKDEAKVDTLVQMYSNMKAAQAAKILETMDEDLAVEILGRMKKKNAAEVLNLMKAEKAQVFSEKFAGYRKR